MSDNSKTPIRNLIAERQVPDSTEDANDLAKNISDRPVQRIIFNVASAGKWKYVAITNYIAMYFLMLTTILGDTFDWWHVQVDPAVLATFMGATIGSTIPLYLQFSIGKKSR